MRSFNFKSALIRSGLAASVLLLASGASFGQQQVNLNAGPGAAILPDGSVVPMWGYTCGTAASGSTAACAPLNAVAAGLGAWSPVVITVPTGQDLQINLTNNLSFTSGNVPTSLVIVGQLGGGLGTTATSAASPDHTNSQPVTWPISPDGPGNPMVGVGTPPVQGTRVQSFSTEVLVGTPASLCWGVTCPVPTPALKPGTYLIESGTHPSIQGPMGLYGVLVVTCAPGSAAGTCATPGTAYPAVGTIAAVTYNSEIPLLLSEIDPVQNAAVNAAVNTSGFNETNVWSGLPGGCGNPSSGAGVYQTCYPPAVNYDPRYFLINGVSFDQSASWKSQFATTPAGATGSVLVRFVNAGLRMHVPSIVGAITGGTAAVPGVSLIAEDGNVLPGVPKVQSEVFLAAGKTQDVLINDPAPLSSVAVFDRHLSLSTDNRRGGGMMANIARTAGLVVTPVAGSGVSETYYCVAGTTLAVTDPSKGVLANDPGANGAVLGVATLTSGSLTFNSDGTFTYAQAPSDTSCGGSFTYLVNGLNTATATIQRCDSGGGNGANGCTVGGAPVAGPIEFTSNVATRYASSPPGVLAGVTSNAGGLALTAVGTGLNADGSFVATPSSGALLTCPIKTPALPAATVCRDLPYQAKNAQGTLSNTGHATVIFLPASGLNVVVRDAKTPLPAGTGTDAGQINDYRWIIEEDRTFYVDPKCQINSTDPALRPTSCPP